jgi:hypothetical protein
MSDLDKIQQQEAQAEAKKKATMKTKTKTGGGEEEQQQDNDGKAQPPRPAAGPPGEKKAVTRDQLASLLQAKLGSLKENRRRYTEDRYARDKKGRKMPGVKKELVVRRKKDYEGAQVVFSGDAASGMSTAAGGELPGDQPGQRTVMRCVVQDDQPAPLLNPKKEEGGIERTSKEEAIDQEE